MSLMNDGHDPSHRPAGAGVGHAGGDQVARALLARVGDVEGGPTAGQRGGQASLEAGAALGPAHLGDAAADDVLGRAATAFGVGPIREAIAPAGIDVVHEHRRGIGHQPQLLLAGRQARLTSPARGDHPGGAHGDDGEEQQPDGVGRGEPDRVDGSQEDVVERGHAQRHREQGRAEAAGPGDDHDRRHEQRSGGPFDERTEHEGQGERRPRRHERQERPADDDQGPGARGNLAHGLLQAHERHALRLRLLGDNDRAFREWRGSVCRV
jgi:hypothetical protein